MAKRTTSDHLESMEPPQNPKHPNSRPPVGFREKILKTPLPRYSGPYSVGFMDLEVPVRQPRTFSNITRHRRPLLNLETVLISIYYPSAFGSGNGPAPDGSKKWSRPTWLPRPRVEVAKGYGKFASVSGHCMVAWFGTTTALTKLPSFRNAPLALHWPPPKNSRRDSKGYNVKNTAGLPPEGEEEKPTFPLLLFSHGLGGTRTTYSSVCGEFASYGFVVVALEHRDGSGPRTFINLPRDEKHAEAAKAMHSEQELRKGYSTMDYIFPKHNAMDTAPGNQKGVDQELRAAQIQLRLAEIEEAYFVMCQICDGKGEEVAKQNLRVKGNLGASSRGLEGIKWEDWTGRFHLKEVTMLGHSFGGATAVKVLRHTDDRFGFIGQGILYDPWGGPINSLETNPKHVIRTPILCINSEAFMYWPTNFKLLMSLCEEVKNSGNLAWMMTVRGSIHISQSDFSILYPKYRVDYHYLLLSSLLLKMTVNPRRAIDLNINGSLEFLKIVMPARISAMNRGDDEQLLEVRVLDQLPNEHMPIEKWTAMRLRIPHEFKLRVTPKIVRKYQWKKAKSEVPRTPGGRPLVGLEVIAPGNEIFMHAAPTAEELRKHGLEPTTELQNHPETGMADVSQYEEQDVETGGGIEQQIMDRG